MRKDAIAECFRRWQKANPAPCSALVYGSAFQLLVAVVLSAQATDQGVNRVTPALFAAAPDAATMAALGEAAIAEYIRSLGLYRSKARHLAQLSTLLCARHAGAVPGQREALEALPGVGRKTANVVLNIVFGLPTIAVDTHVFRVANRMRLACGTTPEAVEQQLLRIVPKPYRLHAHHWLILHGRHICKARRPDCAHCLVADLCPASNAPLSV